jgi:hypothetical protein
MMKILKTRYQNIVNVWIKLLRGHLIEISNIITIYKNGSLMMMMMKKVKMAYWRNYNKLNGKNGQKSKSRLYECNKIKKWVP